MLGTEFKAVYRVSTYSGTRKYTPLPPKHQKHFISFLFRSGFGTWSVLELICSPSWSQSPEPPVSSGLLSSARTTKPSLTFNFSVLKIQQCFLGSRKAEAPDLRLPAHRRLYQPFKERTTLKTSRNRSNQKKTVTFISRFKKKLNIGRMNRISFMCLKPSPAQRSSPHPMSLRLPSIHSVAEASALVLSPPPQHFIQV